MDGVTMRTSYIVMHIAKRNIEGVVFVVPGCNRDGRFVATDNNGNEH